MGLAIDPHGLPQPSINPQVGTMAQWLTTP
jgi:hypothetical protein